MKMQDLSQYNVFSISEVATAGSNLGEVTKGSKTRYGVLYEVQKSFPHYSKIDSLL